MAYVNVKEWSPDQVTEWLRGLDNVVLPYINSFLNNEVKGHQLLSLRSDDLEHLGVYTLGHQEVILEGVEHLRNFHYELDRENLQLLALRLSCASHSLYNELVSKSDKSKVETQTMSDVANIITIIKPLYCWLDRSPFSGQIEYAERKERLLQLSLEMATCAQRDRFAEQPVAEIRTICNNLAVLADDIIQKIRDPMLLQPASLDLATLKKKENELGFSLMPSFHGIHQIADIKFASPAHTSNKLEEGDEIVQVNYQTVVGWQRKKVLLLFQESPPDIVLTVKKRPRHTKVYGQIYMKPYRLPSKKRATPYSRWNDNLQSPRPELLTIPDIEMPLPKLPPIKFEEPVLESGDSSSDSEPLESPHEGRVYPLKPRPVLQRRNTITGASPTSKRPQQNIEQYWNELKHQAAYKHSSSTYIETDNSLKRDSIYLRDKSASCGHGLELTQRPVTYPKEFINKNQLFLKKDVTKKVIFDEKINEIIPIIVKPDQTRKELSCAPDTNSKKVEISTILKESNFVNSSCNINSETGQNLEKSISVNSLLVDENIKFIDETVDEMFDRSNMNPEWKNEIIEELIGSLKKNISGTNNTPNISPDKNCEKSVEMSQFLPKTQEKCIEISPNSSKNITKLVETFQNLSRSAENASGTRRSSGASKIQERSLKSMETIQNIQRSIQEPKSLQFGPKSSELDANNAFNSNTTDLGSKSSDFLSRRTQFDLKSTKDPNSPLFDSKNAQNLPKSSDLSPKSSDSGPKSSDLGPKSSDSGPKSSEINQNPEKTRSTHQEKSVDPQIIEEKPPIAPRNDPKISSDPPKLEIKPKKPAVPPRNFPKNASNRGKFSKSHSTPAYDTTSDENLNKGGPDGSLTPSGVEKSSPLLLRPPEILITEPEIYHSYTQIEYHDIESSPVVETIKTALEIGQNDDFLGQKRLDIGEKGPKVKNRPEPPPRMIISEKKFEPKGVSTPISKTSGVDFEVSASRTEVKSEKISPGVRIMMGNKNKSKKKGALAAKRRKVSVKDLSFCEIAGFLYQRLRNKHTQSSNWEKRFFVLTGSSLYGFKNKDSTKAECLIFLSGFTVATANEVRSRSNAFRVYHTGTAFYFSAENSESMNNWIEFITAATHLTDAKSDILYSESDQSDNEKSKNDTEKKESRLSFKGLTTRKNSNESISGSTSLDRKYLRFFGNSSKKNLPVPTPQFRSYRKVVPPNLVVNQNAPLPKTVIKEVPKLPETPNFNQNTDYESTKLKPKPINYMHASNPSLCDINDYRIHNFYHRTRQFSQRSDNITGFITLEQFMLRSQEEEMRQNGQNHLQNEQKINLNSIQPDVVYGEISSFQNDARYKPKKSKHSRTNSDVQESERKSDKTEYFKGSKTLPKSEKYQERRNELLGADTTDAFYQGSGSYRSDSTYQERRRDLGNDSSGFGHRRTGSNECRNDLTYQERRKDRFGSDSSDFSYQERRNEQFHESNSELSYQERRNEHDLYQGGRSSTRRGDFDEKNQLVADCKVSEPYEFMYADKKSLKNSKKSAERSYELIYCPQKVNDVQFAQNRTLDQKKEKKSKLQRQHSLNSSDQKQVFTRGNSPEKFWLDSLRRSDKISDKSTSKVRLKSATQYTPMSLPLTPDSKGKMNPKFAFEQNLDEKSSKSGLLKSFFGSSKSEEKKEKTLLGSPRLHRAFFGKQNPSDNDWTVDNNVLPFSNLLPPSKVPHSQNTNSTSISTFSSNTSNNNLSNNSSNNSSISISVLSKV